MRRILDGASHYPSGLMTFGRNVHTTAGVASIPATYGEFRALTGLLDAPTALDPDRLAEADASLRDETGRRRTRSRYYWGDLAAAYAAQRTSEAPE